MFHGGCFFTFHFVKYLWFLTQSRLGAHWKLARFEKNAAKTLGLGHIITISSSCATWQIHMGEFSSTNNAINVLVRNYDTFSSMYCFSSDTPLNYQAMNELYVPSPIMPTCRKPCGGPGPGAGNNSGTVMAGKATTQISPIFRDRALAELIKVPDIFRRVPCDVSPTANW